MNTHQKIAYAIVFAVLVALLIYCFSHTTTSTYTAPPDNTTQPASPSPFTEWFAYIDDEYHFTMDYPAESNISEEYDIAVNLAEHQGGDSYTIDKSVTFTLGDGGPSSPGSVGVEVYENTLFTHPGEWFTKQNHIKGNTGIPSKEHVYSMRVPDRGPRFIDGYKADTSYYASIDTGAVTNSKTTVVIKDDTLFKIRTRFPTQADHEHVWDSFNFTDND